VFLSHGFPGTKLPLKVVLMNQGLLFDVQPGYTLNGRVIRPVEVGTVRKS
jgi:hypothetical protein